MKLQNKKAFTMLELVFVVVIIGILSAIAIPRFSITKDDAHIAKAKSTVSAIRNAIAAEKQRRQLRGEFTPISRLSNSNGYDVPIFDAFDGNTSNSVLTYPLQSCKTSSSRGCWVETSTSPAIYTYHMPLSGSVAFSIANNQFRCTAADPNCILLTR